MAAIQLVHRAGIRVHVVIGDNGLTAAAIARRVGIGAGEMRVISGRMLARAWGFLGLIAATLVMAGFFLTLRHAGWHPGDPTGPGTPLNHGYRQATTVAWLGIVACQVGVFTNKLLLAGIAVALGPMAIAGLRFNHIRLQVSGQLSEGTGHELREDRARRVACSDHVFRSATLSGRPGPAGR